MGGNGTQGVQMALVQQNGFSRRVVSPVALDAEPIAPEWNHLPDFAAERVG